MLVVDEADLVLSYGYEEDMKNIAARLPQESACISALRLACCDS